MNEKIDFVITWVDGSDPIWLKEKAKYRPDSNKEDASASRYRAMDTFYYLFRGIEKFAPWVNKVYLITYGHLPKWLNTNNEKLVIVKHKDYIPEKYLPTFSSNVIEFNEFRIEGLSENIVCFNDDMFLIKPTKPTDFYKNGLPCDSAVLNAIAPDRIKGTKKVYLKSVFNMVIINSYFNKKKAIKDKPLNWFNPKYGSHLLRTIFLTPWIHFTGFENWHYPYSIQKSTMKELWDCEYETMDEVCKHKFRMGTDINIWLFCYWQYASNNFYPRNPNIGARFTLTDDQERNRLFFRKSINRHNKFLCLNDAIDSDDDFREAEEIVREYFDKILPEKSSFER